jgi:hypothetical protein
MAFGHGMVPVRQWRNRAVTGGQPLRAATEHLGRPDPCRCDFGRASAFPDDGHEPQGAIREQ